MEVDNTLAMSDEAERLGKISVGFRVMCVILENAVMLDGRTVRGTLIEAYCRERAGSGTRTDGEDLPEARAGTRQLRQNEVRTYNQQYCKLHIRER
jgi:uncharacterized protein YlaI